MYYFSPASTQRHTMCFFRHLRSGMFELQFNYKNNRFQSSDNSRENNVSVTAVGSRVCNDLAE